MIARWLMAAGPKTTRLTISASVHNPDIRALAVAAGWGGAGGIELTINAGVDVVGLRVTNLSHDMLKVINRGRIGGQAGGGVGLWTDIRFSLDNSSGQILGSGGNGGDGGGASCFYNGSYIGAAGGAGGSGAGFWVSGNSVFFQNAQAGWEGGYQVYTGALLGGHTAPWVRGGAGGGGGAVGYPGFWGESGSYGGSASGAVNEGGYSGVSGGAAVQGNALITWISLGTVTGSRV